MIEQLFRLNSAIQNLQMESGLFKRGIAYLHTRLMAPVFTGWYVRKFMSFNRLNTSKPYATISGDCDLERDVNAYTYVVNLLDKFGLKACFAVVGKWVEIRPEEHKLLVREGHEIMNHTYSHPNNPHFNPARRFNKLSYEEQKDEIQKCDEVCRDRLNYEPLGFRTPHFANLHTMSVYRILEELNYRYSSSTIATRTRSFGMPFMEGNVLEFPLSPCPKYPFIFLLPYYIDGASKGYLYHYTEEEFYQLFKELAQLAIKENSYLNLFFDPADMKEMTHFQKILSILKENFAVVTYRELVKSGMFDTSEEDSK